MDKLKKYQQIVEEVLREQVQLPTRDFPNVRDILVIDAKKEHFIQIAMGWDRGSYDHFPAYHLEVTADAKIWVHELRTNVPIDEILVEKGVEATDIIAGMIEPYTLEERKKEGLALEVEA